MKKILIVEDDVGIRETLNDLLEFSGYEVKVSCNGKEGFEQIIAFKPDLVLCDINMPILNGYELLGALNQRMSDELVPTFIYLTAKLDKSDIRKGMNLGADDYITKPFDFNELIEIIKLRLEKRENIIKSSSLETKRSVNEEILNTGIDNNIGKIAIPSSEGLEFIKLKSIIRCEADRSYCIFYLENKTKIVVSKPLKEFEDILLENNFLKVHKSHIVNLIHVNKYIKGKSGYLVMSDDATIPISVRKKDEVLTYLKQL